MKKNEETTISLEPQTITHRGIVDKAATGGSRSQDFFGGGGGRGGPGRGFRGGPFSSFFDSEPDELLINRHVYERDVLPGSYSHVYLLYAYSDWCGNCKIVRKMFDQLHNSYKDKGIRFVTADADVDRSLVYKLGLSRVPSVLAVVNGRVRLYQRRRMGQRKHRTVLVRANSKRSNSEFELKS